MQAKGTFTIQMTAEPPYSDIGGVSLGRVAFDKVFSGDLEGTSRVDMIGVRNAAAPTSAGYVAIERVTGTLAGKLGTFVLQHNGVMNRGKGSLEVTVVPESGTEELAALSGRLTIDIVEKVHHYTFEYALE